jgi:tetratricopeptide (TPR) repeat protein
MTTADEREFLLRSLRDLEAERAAGDIAPEDYETLRDDYTVRAAAALRDERPAVAPSRRRPWLVLAAIVVVAVIAGVIVANSAGQRLPSDALTGSITASSADRLAQARQVMGEGKAVEALKLYDRVLRDDPRNAEALAYHGWLVRLAGLSDEGLRYIDRAIAADPDYPDAHFFRATILWKDKHDPAAAIPEFRRFLASNPPPALVPAVEQALQQAEAEASAANG